MRGRLAPWAAIPLAVGAAALLNSLVGLAWDVVYHAPCRPPTAARRRRLTGRAIL